jgi:peroxiredoxin
MEQFKALAEKSLKAMGKEVFVSFSYGAGQPPFKMREVIAMNEPDFFKTFAAEGITAANSFYKTLKMPATLVYQPGVETYKNVSIDAVSVKFDVADSNDLAMKEVAKIYGPDGLSYYVAQKDKLAFIAFGPDSKNSLKTLIDTPTDKAVGGDLKTAMTILGPDAQKADMIGSINYIKLAKGGMNMVSQMGGPEAPGMFSEMAKAMDVPTQSCMAVSATVAKGKINSRLALPKQHLIEIISAAMKIQMQMMQQQNSTSGGMMGGAPQPVTPASSLQPMSAEPKNPLEEWIGKPAPDLKMTDLQGNTISIAGLKGKKIVVDFWATWCPPCKQMIPAMIELRNSIAPEKLAILAVSNEPVDRLNKFAKDYKLNYTVIASGNEMPSPYGAVAVLPTTFFIDSSGTIRHILIGSHELADLKAAIDGMK